MVDRLLYYANARARKLATPRVVAVTRGAQFSFWAKLKVVDNRWVPSGASLCVKWRKLTAGKSE